MRFIQVTWHEIRQSLDSYTSRGGPLQLWNLIWCISMNLDGCLFDLMAEWMNLPSSTFGHLTVTLRSWFSDWSLGLLFNNDVIIHFLEFLKIISVSGNGRRILRPGSSSSDPSGHYGCSVHVQERTVLAGSFLGSATSTGVRITDHAGSPVPHTLEPGRAGRHCRKRQTVAVNRCHSPEVTFASTLHKILEHVPKCSMH